MKTTMKMMLVAFTVIAITNVASAKGNNNKGNNRPQIQVIVVPPVQVVHTPMRPAPMMRPTMQRHMHHRHEFAHRKDFGHRGNVRNGYACR